MSYSRGADESWFGSNVTWNGGSYTSMTTPGATLRSARLNAASSLGIALEWRTIEILLHYGFPLKAVSVPERVISAEVPR